MNVLCMYLTVTNVLLFHSGLDLTKYYIGNRPSNEPPPIYDLYGVVNHHGGIMGGHYTSYAKYPDIQDYKRNLVGECIQ
jgi:hypothetical protein